EGYPRFCLRFGKEQQVLSEEEQQKDEKGKDVENPEEFPAEHHHQRESRHRPHAPGRGVKGPSPRPVVKELNRHKGSFDFLPSPPRGEGSPSHQPRSLRARWNNSSRSSSSRCSPRIRTPWLAASAKNARVAQSRGVATRYSPRPLSWSTLTPSRASSRRKGCGLPSICKR